MNAKAPPSHMARFYLLRGERVEIVRKWNGPGPRNVLIRYEDGRLVVRPFRGLRKIVGVAPEKMKTEIA